MARGPAAVDGGAMTTERAIPRPRRGKFVYMTLWAATIALFIAVGAVAFKEVVAIEHAVEEIGQTTAIALSELAREDVDWNAAAAEAILGRVATAFPPTTIIPSGAVRAQLTGPDGTVIRSMGSILLGPIHTESITVLGPAGPVAILTIAHSLRPSSPALAAFVLLIATTGIGGFAAFKMVRIADLKQNEARLRSLTQVSLEKHEEAAEAHARLAIILEASSDGFALFDRNDRLVFWNHTFARFNGEVANVLRVGLSIEQMTWAMAENLPSLSRIQVRDWLNDRVRDLATDGEHVSVYRTPDRRLIRSHERRMDNGQTVATLSDITELTRKDRELEKSERQLRQVSNNLPITVSLVQRDGRLGFVNRARAEAVGVSPEGMVGRPWRDFHAPADAATLQPILELGFCGESVTQEVTLGEEPTHRQVEVRVVPLHRGGDVDSVFIFGIDVTDRWHLEEQLRQAQKMDTLGQLTGGIAHDFNNLLTVVLGNLDLAEEALPAGAPSTHAVKSARRGALRAAELTQRLLAFSRRQMLQPREESVADLIGGFADLLVRSLGEQIEVRLRLAEDMPLALIDAGQLENAVLNLALNARDAMPSGGVVTIETGTAVVETPRRLIGDDMLVPGRYATVSVTDTGTGMSAAVLSRAFDPFFTTKDVGKGSGLGLPMIYGFTRQSGGGVEIDTAADRGTTVTLYFPVSETVAPRSEPVGTREKVGLPRGSERLLVVEDDADVREHLEASLRALGYRVVAAADGPAAREALATQGPFDLIVSDVVLPGGMDGRAVVRAARAHGFRGPALFTTGYARGAFDSAAREADVAVLMKPYSREKLARRVRALLDGSEKVSPADRPEVAADAEAVL